MLSNSIDTNSMVLLTDISLNEYKYFTNITAFKISGYYKQHN